MDSRQRHILDSEVGPLEFVDLNLLSPDDDIWQVLNTCTSSPFKLSFSGRPRVTFQK